MHEASPLLKRTTAHAARTPSKTPATWALNNDGRGEQNEAIRGYPLYWAALRLNERSIGRIWVGSCSLYECLRDIPVAREVIESIVELFRLVPGHRIYCMYSNLLLTHNCARDSWKPAQQPAKNYLERTVMNDWG